MSDPNLMSGIDDGEQVRQDVNKVTEEDVKRVQASAAKAKQIQTQIKKDKAINNQFASFLQFLLKNLKNDDIISALYKSFFIVTNPKNGNKYLKKKINDVVIIGFFAPFFWDKIIEFKLQEYFEDIIPNGNLDLQSYINYIKKLSKKHHDNIPIDKNSLLELLCNIIKEFELSDSKDEDNINNLIRNALNIK